MILYYSPGACSLVAHIALEEAKCEFEARRVTLAQGEHRTPEYQRINPHARVPALDTGRGIVTENIAILNLIARLFRAAGSVPLDDDYAAARCNELLGWFSSTVHISFAQVWRASRFTRDEAVHPAIIAGGRENLDQHFAEIEQLCGDGWLVGNQFTAADSYVLTFFRWGRRIEFDMSRYPRWAALCERLLAEPAVGRALQREGLDADEFTAAAPAPS